MGRPITVENGTFVGIRLSADLMRRIEAYAAKHKVDRSAAIRALLEMGLASAQDYYD